ncbi:hypothetical protein SCH4B_0251 [Ruegeria sp. TrichCH4B]|nr:hypothetical protein SCH4B_0251 [Ruegeria sp. TrichCH4B]
MHAWIGVEIKISIKQIATSNEPQVPQVAGVQHQKAIEGFETGQGQRPVWILNMCGAGSSRESD